MSLPVNPLYDPKPPRLSDVGEHSSSDFEEDVPQKSDYPYYCDSCRSGFETEETYRSHLTKHIWCDAPGCRFTCLKAKEWKLELHKSALHDRPDAPDLTNTHQYLETRRDKFPTRDKVLTKVEELEMKAARGAILDSEQRRWLRMQGVRFERSGVSKRVSSSEKQTVEQGRDTQRGSRGSGITLGNIRQLRGRARTSAMVEVMKEKYQGLQRAPSYYVCHRCGEKGQHWSHECPTQGDKTYDRNFRPAVQSRNQTSHAASVETAHDHMECNSKRRVLESSDASSSGSESDKSRNSIDKRHKTKKSSHTENFGVQSLPCSKSEQGDEPIQIDSSVDPLASKGENTEHAVLQDTPHQAREAVQLNSEVQIQHHLQNATNSSDLQKSTPHSRAHQNASSVVRNTATKRRRVPPLTLYNRLTEDERLTERGLILQAIRYFVATDFLTNYPAWEHD